MDKTAGAQEVNRKKAQALIDLYKMSDNMAWNPFPWDESLHTNEGQ